MLGRFGGDATDGSRDGGVIRHLQEGDGIGDDFAVGPGGAQGHGVGVRYHEMVGSNGHRESKHQQCNAVAAIRAGLLTARFVSSGWSRRRRARLLGTAFR